MQGLLEQNLPAFVTLLLLLVFIIIIIIIIINLYGLCCVV